MRENDSGLKTQIRFGSDDIALYTKMRGTDDAFKMVDMSQLVLPQIEHNASMDKALRTSTLEAGISRGQDSEVEVTWVAWTDRSSGSQELMPSQKKHKDLNADSSKSNDENDSPSSRKGPSNMNISDI